MVGYHAHCVYCSKVTLVTGHHRKINEHQMGDEMGKHSEPSVPSINLVNCVPFVFKLCSIDWLVDKNS